MLRFIVVAHCDGNALFHNHMPDGSVDIVFLIPGNGRLINLSYSGETDVVYFTAMLHLNAHVAE